MNRRPAHTVHGSIRPSAPVTVTWIAALWLTLSGSWISGCIEIQGGAAELSWALRSEEGESVETCQDVRVEEVRLCWEVLEDGTVLGGGGTCVSDQKHDFPCFESSGVTGFNLEPGPTAFWIEPVCADGESADAGTYQVPPPIVRNVEEGQIVSLNSLLLIVNPTGGGDCPPAGCTCIRP